jgi:predicted small metal-binding protein
MKILYCRDAGFDCDAVVRAENEQEVLNQAAKHAKEVHGVEPTPELADSLSLLINEE